MSLRDLSLEMSLKAFRAQDGSDIDTVLHTLFRQWAPLVRQSDPAVVSVMLWTADGSEILDYRGEAEGEIEWGRYIGYANAHGPVPNDPEGIDPHSRTYLYTEDPIRLTYGRLGHIVARIKTLGRELLDGRPIRVGATFDPGPEFARSPFKYTTHPEICAGKLFGRAAFVSCSTTLHADATRYAGFPTGIPEGLSLGSFLGGQCRAFLDDLGFDFVWFSNGFGFGIETLATIGAVFDGTRFIPEQRFSSRDRILDFWRSFRAACPGHQVRIRGTNLTTGIDLSTDGAPIREIYWGGFNIVAPPNSPWAALDGNFGMELAGWMSHVAELPSDNEGFLFRYYIHDPWWKNSPWLDRYGREAHDLYLPMAVCRIDGAGRIESPSRLAFLSVDDSFGQMPERVPREVTPLLLDALSHTPDAAPPTVWVYPFAEYHEATFGGEPRLAEPFAGDWLVVGAINEGLPLNAVVSTSNFLASLAAKPGLYRGSVLVTPVPEAGTPLAAALVAHVEGGGKVLFYGPVSRAGNRQLDLLGLRLTTPISGELQVGWPEALPDNRQPCSLVIHRPEINAGGIDSVLGDGAAHVHVLAHVHPVGDATQRRVAALHRADPAWHGGAVAWVRGTVSASFKGGNLLSPDDPGRYARGESLLRHALAALGWEIGLLRRPRQPDLPLTSTAFGADMPLELVQNELAERQDTPVIGVHRHNGALWLSGFIRDTTSSLALRFPGGAPLLIGAEAWIEDGRAVYAMPRAWHRECRVLVDQAVAGMVSCSEATCEQIGWTRRILVRNLRDATVTVLHPPGAKVQLLVNAPWPHVIGQAPVQQEQADGSIVCQRVTGSLRITW